jgi:hypothetical protein
MKISSTFIVALFVLISATSDAQESAIPADTTTLFQIDTKDGNSYVGKILEITAEQVLIDTETLGVLTLKQINIKSIVEINPTTMKNGEHWFDNPQAARYFWAPNGYGLKKGEGYYQNVWVLANQVSVGVSDYVSIGVGMVPLFLFGGTATPIWFTPKVSIPIVKDKFNLGAGVMFATAIGEDATSIALPYTIATFGTRDRNTSIGVGYGWAGGQWAKNPTFTVGFMARVSRNAYFISENYYIPTAEEDIGLLSVGGRKILKKVGLDWGFFLPIISSMDRLVVIPWLGITAPLGKKRG